MRTHTKRIWMTLPIAALLLAALLLQGCTYMGARGRDALDILDIGITITPELRPDGAIYFDFFNMLPIGYSTVEGKLLGIGNRQIGWLDYESSNWGVLAYGSEKHGAGVFNPADPRQARPDQADVAERQTYDAGFIGAFTGENRSSKFHYIECTRIVHIGWIGVVLNVRPIDIFDFLAGWVGVDFLNDDGLVPPKAVEAVEPETCP